MTAALSSRPLPAWIEGLLASPPPAGSGIHRWLYRVACALAPWRDAQGVYDLLAAAAKRCARTVTPHELNDAVRRRVSNWQPDGVRSEALRLMTSQFRPTERAASSSPKPDWKLIRRIAENGEGIADLWEASPIRVEGDTTAGGWLKLLFPGVDPLFCLAETGPPDAHTLPKSGWRSIDGAPNQFSFMVPSSMTALRGINLEGRPSARCYDNCVPPRYLVVEFDFQRAPQGNPKTEVDALLDELAAESPPRTAQDLCAGILLHMIRNGAPLALALYSGGKSLHGWFPAAGASDDTLGPFFRSACQMGADPATWSRVQLVRIPEGWNAKKDRRQAVFYFNPAALPAA